MSVNYIIDFSDPAILSFVIGPGTVDNSTSLQLFGQGAFNYGEGSNENFLHLLENFAHTIAPINPIVGQLWYDKTQGIFKFFDGTNFVSTGSVFVGMTAPTGPNPTGQLWYDTSIPQLKVFDGAIFISVADRYVLKAGDAMDAGANLTFSATGEVLGLPAVPSGDDAAASKLYIDNNSLPVTSGTTTVVDFVIIDTDTTTVKNATENYGFVVDTVGNTDAGGIFIQSGDTAGDNQFAIKAENSAGGLRFSVKADSGDTVIAGDLSVNAGVTVTNDLAASAGSFTDNVTATTPPSAGDHLTNKTYVDGQVFVLPAGVVVPFAAFAAPTGWLECDGSAVSRTVFATLFAVLGEAYGNGDGSTTFNLPDYRGEFLRGFDNTAGNDPNAGSRTDRGDGTTGDEVGTKQLDEFESHTHSNVGFNNFLFVGAYPGFTGSGDAYSQIPSGASGGSETRPRNVNVMYIIFAG